MKEIPLTQGQVAIVCDCHYHLVKDYKWFSQWDDVTETFYALRGASMTERLLGSAHTIPMHRVINGTPKGFNTDHKNHDTLDNQCVNLRTATASQNRYNQGKMRHNKSGYKGVNLHKGDGKFHARIMVNSKRIHLGYYDTPEEAAHAYDKAAKELHGEFAQLNFP